MIAGKGTVARRKVASIYLKRIRHPNGFNYVLSETILDHGILKSRDLMDLGGNPSVYIEYMGGAGFCFKPVLEENLRNQGVRFDTEDLEAIFKPFLRPDIRSVIERFERNIKPRGRCAHNLDEVTPRQRHVHIFDARRLYFLRFGRTDSGELSAKHWKFLDVFLCKSRDEIESLLDTMERQLHPREYANYVYAALGAPLFFPEFLREYPTALNREKLDGCILQELCRTDGDEDFFLGVERTNGGGLHPYLRKYAWLYFDFEFQVETWFEGFSSRTRSIPPAQPPAMPLRVAYEVFGISAEEFAGMSRKELKRTFRRKAKKMHPDRGGRHEDFLKLSEAYELLHAVKKKQ